MDPRVIRTKQLLVEAFLNVSQEKEMTQITVKNITDRATVNRATFYAHFNDKYEILDYSLSMTVLKDIKETLSISETLNGQIISKLFVSIAYYLENVQNACKLNRETFCNHAHKCLMLQHKYPEHDSSIIENSASFLAAGLCGLARHWLNTSELSAEQFINQNLPFLLHHITNL